MPPFPGTHCRTTNRCGEYRQGHSYHRLRLRPCLSQYREDWPSALIVDLVGWMKTYDKLRERVSSPDLLFPGHDRLLLENYPEAAQDITRLV
jgi:hypothetical protein